MLDITKMAQLGWTAQISLRDGIENTYRWCLEKGAF
jgi:nucleoside-diphosphate-sugar epimerase